MHQLDYLILGPHASGKDETADILVRHLHKKYCGPTSYPLVKSLYGCVTTLTVDILKRDFFRYHDSPTTLDILMSMYYSELKSYTSWRELYTDRHKFSDLLYQFGRYLRIKNGNISLVSSLIAQGTDIIVGLREKAEMNEVIKVYNPRNIWWIDRPNFKKDRTLEFSVFDVIHSCVTNYAFDAFNIIPNYKDIEYLTNQVIYHAKEIPKPTSKKTANKKEGSQTKNSRSRNGNNETLETT